MSRSRRALIAGASVLVAVLAASIELHYFFVGRAVCHPPRKRITDVDRARAHAALPTLEEVSFTTSDGLRLSGFYISSKNGAVVVMGHGLGDNRMHLLPDAEMLARHGYGSLLFDWRAHGDSEGDTSTWSDLEQADIAAAIDYAVRRPDVTGEHIAALGFSIGASTVALEAARDRRVRAVILEAVYTSAADEIRVKFGSRGALSSWPAALGMRWAGMHIDRIRPIDYISKIHPRPLLEIAGGGDLDTPVAVSSRVFEAAAEPKRMWVVEEAGHGEYERVAAADFERVLTTFLDDTFFRAEGG